MSDKIEPTDELERMIMPISEEWRMRAREALDDLGEERQWLAAKVGTSKTSITNVLSTSQTSDLVGPISKVLGIAVPFAPIRDNREFLWLAAGKTLRKLSSESFDKELDKVARLISKFRNE